MKKLLLFLLFLPFLGCNNVIKNKQTSVDFDCPRIFFSTDERFFIDSIDNSISLEDVFMKAELNNFALNKKCQRINSIAVIPIDILIIVKPMENLNNLEINIPVYIKLLDQDDNVLETQYFMISGFVKQDSETKIFLETDIKDTLEVITQYLETSQAVIGFMLDDKKKDILN